MTNTEYSLMNRFKANGLELMEDSEVLELIISRALPPDRARQLASELIKEYGSLKTIFNLEPKRLLRFDGMNEQTAVLISLFSNIASRIDLQANEKIKYLKDVETKKEYVKNILRIKPKECFLAVSLTNNNKIISSEIISSGVVNSASIEIRLLLEMLLCDKAERALIAHNHPDTSPKPSQQDIITTLKISEALEASGIILDDHIIVGSDVVLSIKQETDYIEFKD